jgi:hypothetical protein
MPQFDFFSFFVQIFWLCIFSCIFYLLYLKFPVAKSAEAIKMRGKLLSLKSLNNKANQFDIQSNAKAFAANIVRSIYKLFK